MLSSLGEAFQDVINKQITFAVVYKSVNWEVARSDTILSVSEATRELQPHRAQLSVWLRSGSQLRPPASRCFAGDGDDRLISRYWVLFKGELCMVAF